MRFDIANVFRSRSDSMSDLQRRASSGAEPVTWLNEHNLSGHELFGLEENASFEAIRQSCWPISPALRESAGEAGGGPPVLDGPPALPPRNAAAAELRALRAVCASEMVSRANLDTNFQRLNQIDLHYHAVALGAAALKDHEFATTTMRSFVTWLRSLEVLDKEQYGQCGECATKLLELVVSPEPGSRFTVRELGATSNLALPSDESEAATHFVTEILPLLRRFHEAVENKGVGSALLEARIDHLMASTRSLMGCDIEGPGALTGGAREAEPQRRVFRSLRDLIGISRVLQPLRDCLASPSTLFPQGPRFDK